MSEAIKLFQYNTLGALMAGLYGGTLTVGELLEHGDLGLGTLDSIDGELIVLDGKAYQAKGSEGKVEVVEVSPDEKVPYAAVVPHQAEVIFRQRFEMTDKEANKRKLEAGIREITNNIKYVNRSEEIDYKFSIEKSGKYQCFVSNYNDQNIELLGEIEILER